uniref:Uncharacterized protein n=1 Tax=Meloidogyne enterolobii TaxID=390850 RepID=A0A6V7XNQ4_MELEN|nr:unnamed protein product [Meloidogyne enterolobii]
MGIDSIASCWTRGSLEYRVGAEGPLESCRRSCRRLAGAGGGGGGVLIKSKV